MYTTTAKQILLYLWTAILLLQPSARAQTEIAAPSALQVNLGYLPVDWYDYNHSPSSADYGLAVSCPGAQSIRACYQSAFANFHAQHVTGVRFFFGLCGAFYSTPLSGCGSNWTQVSGPASAWTINLRNFFLDVYNAGIYNVTPTMLHGDNTVSQYLPAANPPNGGSSCVNTPPVLQYVPGEPYGRIPCTNSYPYNCPAGQNCAAYCQASAGFPVDDHYNGYNCSPANPIFVGWQHTYDVWNAIIQAAFNTPNPGMSGLT